jgi:hypothetical protein
MPPAKKTAENATEEESEQSGGTSEVQPEKKVAKKRAAKPKVEEYDQDDPIAQIMVSDVVVFMRSGYSYYGPDVEFTKEDPFQRMDAVEANRLMSSIPERFCLATKEQIEKFYLLG